MIFTSLMLELSGRCQDGMTKIWNISILFMLIHLVMSAGISLQSARIYGELAMTDSREGICSVESPELFSLMFVHRELRCRINWFARMASLQQSTNKTPPALTRGAPSSSRAAECHAGAAEGRRAPGAGRP